MTYPFSLSIPPPKQFRDRRDGPFVTWPRLLRLGHLASAQESIVRQDGPGLRIDTSSIDSVLISSRCGITRVFVSQLHCTFADRCIVPPIYRSTNSAHQVSEGSLPLPRDTGDFPRHFGDKSGHFHGHAPRHVRKLRGYVDELKIALVSGRKCKRGNRQRRRDTRTIFSPFRITFGHSRLNNGRF